MDRKKAKSILNVFISGYCSACITSVLYSRSGMHCNAIFNLFSRPVVLFKSAIIRQFLSLPKQITLNLAFSPL